MKILWLFLAVPMLVVGCAPAIQVRVFSPGVQISVAHVPDVTGVVQVVWSSPSTDMSPMNGSGTVVAKRGPWSYIVTCRHVIRPLTLFGLTAIKEVVRADGEIAEIVVEDKEHDLALIRTKLPRPAKVYGLAETEIGRSVWSVGWVRLGLENEVLAPSVIHVQRGYVTMHTDRHICHNAGAGPGFSGGPVLNERAEVVGIIRAISGPAGGILGYAVRAKFVGDLLKVVN